VAFVSLRFALPCLGQSSPEQSSPAQTIPQTIPVPAVGQASDHPPAASIIGTLVDSSGALIAGAKVRLVREDQSQEDQSREDQSPAREILSSDDGQFSFTNIAPGPFRLTITAAGFTTRVTSGTLSPGQVYILETIPLEVAPTVTDVEVSLSRPQVAEAQVKDEEKQRVLGFIPNFYVSYDPHPVPLNPRQKFELAWKTVIDPFSFAVVGAFAAVQQGDDDFNGYGQGAQGYGKRYGASFADFVSGTFIGAAILPTILKQDPRYFYKGTGSARSRTLYALANAVICKGDNGRWQPNYSNVLGSLAAGGISNIYYPAANRHGLGLTFENALVGIGTTGAANLFQEFVVKKFTRNTPDRTPALLSQ